MYKQLEIVEKQEVRKEMGMTVATGGALKKGCVIVT